MPDPTIQGPVDAGKALQAAVVTKTASFNGVSIDQGAGYAPGGGGRPMQFAVPIAAGDFTSGDETYTFKLQESSDDATYADCSAAVPALAGSIGGSVVGGGNVQKRFVRYVLTIAGTTPTITYGPIYLVPQR